MSNLSTDISNLKKKYREIFLKSSEELTRRIEEVKSEDVLKFLNEDISKEIYEELMKILDYRKNFSCKGCATCCKLACSEFSYEELQEKAQNGDNFATQFTSIFVPYKNKEEAQKIYPEYFELLEKELNGEDVYFYHCPKLNADNRCSDYENRPQICRDFPDNPLSLLPAACGYVKWKEEVEPTALMLHAMLEIVEFYKTKISQ
jgi:Fe-S-cluster containining protein